MNRALFLASACLGVLPPPVNNGISFQADRYYFELSYGQGMEFYVEQYLPGSTIWKLEFKSILRVELPPAGSTYRAFRVPQSTHVARLAWNSSKTLALATFGEYAVILSREFQILSTYRNTEDVHWLTDEEVRASVETGGRVSKYERTDFAINVRTDRYRRLR